MSQSWYALLEAALEQGQALPHTRYLQLATVADDMLPRVRTCVFRESCATSYDLFIHTDARSSKCHQLRHYPSFEICWYFPLNWQQFRLSGTARMTDNETGPDTDIRIRQWQALSRRSQLSYFQPTPGVPFENEQQTSAADGSESLSTPPATFVLIRLMVDKVDFLDLSTAPHTRMEFSKSTHGQWQSRALNP